MTQEPDKNESFIDLWLGRDFQRKKVQRRIILDKQTGRLRAVTAEELKLLEQGPEADRSLPFLIEEHRWY